MTFYRTYLFFPGGFLNSNNVCKIIRFLEVTGSKERDQHMQTHRPNRFYCPKCHKKFSSAFGVRRHMRLHGKVETEGTP
jgi:hypothetical protein